MSRETMARAMAGRDSQLAGIAQYVRGDGANVVFDIGWPEIERDIAWAGRLIDVSGLAGADHVLVTARNCEGPWFSPLVRVLHARGIVFSNGEPYGWDAKRSATFLNLLPIKAIIALSGETAEALTAEEQTVAKRAELSLIWARPGAFATLHNVGLEPAMIAMLGPALAAECPVRNGLHLDPEQWLVQREAGGLTLTIVGDRAYRAQSIPLGVDGEVDPAPCDCGLPGARVRLAV